MTPSTHGLAKPSIALVTIDTVRPHSGTVAVRLMKPGNAPACPNHLRADDRPGDDPQAILAPVLDMGDAPLWPRHLAPTSGAKRAFRRAWIKRVEEEREIAAVLTKPVADARALVLSPPSA